MAKHSTEPKLDEEQGPRTPRVRASTSQAERVETMDDGRETERETSRDTGRGEAERSLSEDERFALFQSSMSQSVLPDLPPMPGYHVCWLTTNNPRDTIATRIRLGYELITQDSFPGWAGASLKSGELAGVVSVNEMVAARISLSLYNRYMREFHEVLPRQEEEKLRQQVAALKEQGETSILQEGDGTAEIVQRARPMPEYLT